ncbi:hypothetical protein HY625_02635 [Candidatus Uhrbacteria bacterium]|nr:hypothetical protein [Candidatus Uhrbacteria bacterium]
MQSFFAKLILRKYRPTIVAVAGSVGKTMVKQAVRAVLSSGMNVRMSSASSNDYRGALWTIIGGGAARALGLFFRRDPEYPRVLVLEYGIDADGDMERLMALAAPDIGVLTSLAPAKLDTDRSLERMLRAQSLVAVNGKRSGWTVLAVDDERVQALRNRVRGRVMSYGLHESADVRAIEIAVNQEVRDGSIIVKGTTFKLVYKGSAVPIALPGVLGVQHIAGALGAATVGIICEMNLVAIAEAFRLYEAPPGRMRLLSGIKRTLLIDDTYTAVPASVVLGLQALDTLAVKPGAEKFAVIGDMESLGAYTGEGHRDVGERAAAIGIDYLVTVGKLSRDIGRAAREKGIPEDRVYHFTTPEEAGRFIQDRLEEGDAVYVSGSAGMRMEKIVKELMAEPLKADGLLVRR